MAFFVAKDMMPFEVVERPGFIHLVKSAVPQYKVPGRSYFCEEQIPDLYKEVRASVEQQPC